MRKPLVRVALAVAVGVFLVTPLLAGSYIVTLKNGSVFSTRYKPQEAPWDTNKVLFLTEWGNDIVIVKDDIDTVVAEFEKGGFGHVLSNTMIEIGSAPNDAEVPGQTDTSPSAALERMLQQQQAPPQNYTIQQFAEPSATGGIPLGYLGYGNQQPPVGGVITVTNGGAPPPNP